MTRKDANKKILTSLSPKFVLAWDDIVNNNLVEFINSVKFESLPAEQQLCCLHLASLGHRLKQAKPPKHIANSEDLSYLDQYQSLTLDIIQQQDYKLANQFIKDYFQTMGEGMQIIFPAELSNDQKITILFWACLCGWPVEKYHIPRLYEKIDHKAAAPFDFTKELKLNVGHVLETSALSVMDGQTIPWNERAKFPQFTKTFKKAIPYGMITRKRGADIKDWHYKLLRKDGVVIDSDKEKFLSRFKKESEYTV